MKKHVHDWRLMSKSDIATRFKDVPPTRDKIIDLVLDPGDRSERWRCPDCGEERFYHSPGFMELLTKTTGERKQRGSQAKARTSKRASQKGFL